MKVNVGAPFHIVNKESLEFLFDHDLIPRKKYDNLFELQLELDELLSFVNVNVTETEYDKQHPSCPELSWSYDSMFFAVVEYHIYNTIQIGW